MADVSDSLDGTYFILEDSSGTVAFWFDVDDSGTAEPTHGADRSVEITTIVTDDSADTVAGKVSTAVNADAQFSTSVATNVVTVTDAAVGFRTNQNAGTSGFTITTTTPGTTKGKITYIGNSSLSESNTTTATLTITRADAILEHIEYWRTDLSSVRIQETLAMTERAHLFKYDTNGRREQISPDATATAITTPVKRISSIIFNNRVILGFQDQNQKPIKYNPDDDADYFDLGGDPPDGFLFQEHIGRLWMNDKDNKDRLHYSTTGDHEEWNGTGDSGAIDLPIDDGDSEGITAIFPPFKGRLIVAKGTKIYQITGNSPETFKIEVLSSGIGAKSHDSVVPVDQDDVLFISERGFHSLAATARHGDYSGTFLSKKIQPTFNNFNTANLDTTQGTYIPDLNSVAWSISEENDSTNNNIYLFSTIFKEWYRWPNQSCTAISSRLFNSSRRMIIGTADGRLIEAQQSKVFSDFTTTGISYKIKTGAVYVDDDPTTIKAFKRIGFLFRPKGAFSFTVQIQIDNQALQSISFAQTIQGDALGTDFLLGTSVLGNNNVLNPEMRTIDGYGRGITITVTQSGTDEQVEIYGYVIEFELADIRQEVLTSS